MRLIDRPKPGRRASSTATDAPAVSRAFAVSSASASLASAAIASAAIASTEPAPDLDPIAIFEASRAEGLESALWYQPDHGSAIVGIGRAWAVETEGPDRFAVADAAWRGLSSELRASSTDGAAAPILLGGLGFTGCAPVGTSVWASFGPASLVLPSLVWRRTPGAGATVTMSVVGHPGADHEDALRRLWRRVAARSEQPPSETRPPDSETPPGSEARPPESPRLRVLGERPDRRSWDRIVAMFAGAVGRGRLDKVVLARRVDVSAADGGPLDIASALRRLARTAPESTIYAFTRNGSTFLGATPERLVRTEHRAFETVALAGSAPRSDDPLEDARLGAALLASEKDREEHAVVVAMLRESLAPIVEKLTVAATPGLLDLRHVRHLMTPIAGRLREDAGLLSLAQRLHPTPAVGGEPRDLALELIAEHEGFDRGWYAGPVGWVDRDGDGELVVALRCGVVEGSRATLFAGCGIVADSHPDREWEESRIKLRAVANALGGMEEDA